MRLLKRRTILILVAAIGVAIILAGCATSAPVRQKRQVKPATGDSRFYNSIYYKGTSGQVGHHMTAGPRATCSGKWTTRGAQVTRGSLPRGLRTSGSRVEGTPKQPGTWSVSIKLKDLKCNNKSYGDKTLSLDFYIKGYAPRKVR